MTERHPRRGSGPKGRRRAAPVAVETLEGRQLLAYTPLGFSIPDLAIVTGYSGPVGAYGGQLSVTVEVANYGQSSIPEPLAQLPGQPSSADAGPSQVNVFLSANGHRRDANRILLGTINIPPLAQNRLAQVTSTFTLPENPPPGFPGVGGTAFITMELDPGRQVRDLDRTNNVLRQPATFQVIPNLPSLQAIALGLPPVMNPGDTVVPQAKIANYGAAATNLQGPVVVQFVASPDPDLGPGDLVLGTFTIDNILPLSQAPTRRFLPGDANLVDPPNVVVVSADQVVTLPESAEPYYVGLVIDPLNQIEQTAVPHLGLTRIGPVTRVVADSGLGLPPAGILDPMAPTTPPPFPLPPFATPTGTPAPPVVVPLGTPAQLEALRAARRLPNGARPADLLQQRQAALQEASARARPAAELVERLAARRALRGGPVRG